MEKMSIIHRSERSSLGHRVHFTDTEVVASKVNSQSSNGNESHFGEM